jgi:hypothetical protein
MVKYVKDLTVFIAFAAVDADKLCGAAGKVKTVNVDGSVVVEIDAFVNGCVSPQRLQGNRVFTFKRGHNFSILASLITSEQWRELCSEITSQTNIDNLRFAINRFSETVFSRIGTDPARVSSEWENLATAYKQWSDANV